MQNHTYTVRLHVLEKKMVEIQYKFGELNFLTSKNNYKDLAH
jgi:hypothetical protein